MSAIPRAKRRWHFATNRRIWKQTVSESTGNALPHRAISIPNGVLSISRSSKRSQEAVPSSIAPWGVGGSTPLDIPVELVTIMPPQRSFSHKQEKRPWSLLPTTFMHPIQHVNAHTFKMSRPLLHKSSCPSSLATEALPSPPGARKRPSVLVCQTRTEGPFTSFSRACAV